MSEADPLADLLMEGEQAAEVERSERRILLERVTELLDKVGKLAQAVDLLNKIERAEHTRAASITISERDEYGQIKTFEVH